MFQNSLLTFFKCFNRFIFSVSRVIFFFSRVILAFIVLLSVIIVAFAWHTDAVVPHLLEFEWNKVNLRCQQFISCCSSKIMFVFGSWLSANYKRLFCLLGECFENLWKYIFSLLRIFLLRHYCCYFYSFWSRFIFFIISSSVSYR